MPTLARARLCGLMALAVLLALASCGRVRKGTPQWFASDVAVLRCTVAAPNLRPPPLLDELPSPPLPTGLLARSQDPLALDQLGFERDRVVCASLQSPDPQLLERAPAAIDEFLALRREIGGQLARLGPCRCTHAALVDASGLVPGCLRRASADRCRGEPDDPQIRAEIERLMQLLAPLQRKLATTEIPRLHWRLAGPSDRPGHFVARASQLLARHSGGSELFLPRTPLPPRPGSRLITALLNLDGVVAVLRQDSGRALLVVRELDDELILDHFAYPVAEGSDPELVLLLPYFDDAQIARTRRALAAPAQIRGQIRVPLFRPRRGSFVELDHAALARVDRAVTIAASFAGEAPTRDEAAPPEPMLLVDRLAYQVPYGHDGQRLRARLRLSDAGRRWLTDAGEGQLAGGLASLSAGASRAEGLGRSDLPFVLRGQPTRALFRGPRSLAAWLAALESRFPDSVEGEADDWHVDLPTGPFPTTQPGGPLLERLQVRLSERPHELQGELVKRGRILELELEPR